MNYQEFYRLLIDATEFTSVDRYIVECGGSVPESVPDDKLLDVLQLIYDIAHGNIKTLRELSGATQTEFARQYGIPKRSIGNWETGLTEAPGYVVRLLQYAVFSDLATEQ